MAQETTLEKELTRLAKRAAPPEYLRRKRELSETQVGELTKLLQPLVERHLADEADGDVAAEWLKMSQDVLASIAADSSVDLRQRPQFQAVAEMVRKGLSEELLARASRPSAAEIGDHAVELAQCVLSNWFSLLEHAKQDNPGKVLALTPNGVPESAPRNALWRGTDAFVVPEGDVAIAFQQFLDATAAKAAINEIAPALYLVPQGQKLYLAGSEADAKQRAAAGKAVPKPAPRPAPIPDLIPGGVFFPLPEKFQAAYRTLDVIIGHHESETASARTGSFMDEEMEKLVATVAALDADAKSVPYLNLQEISEDGPGFDIALMNDKFSAECADLTIKKLDSVVHPGKFKILWQMKKGRLEKILESEEELMGGAGPYGSVCRMTVMATGLAASGTMKKLEHGIDRAMLTKYMKQQPQAGQVYKAVLNSTRQALARPQAVELGNGIQKMIIKAEI